MKELWYCEECCNKHHCILIIDETTAIPNTCFTAEGADGIRAKWFKHNPENNYKTQLLNKANEGER